MEGMVFYYLTTKKDSVPNTLLPYRIIRPLKI
jgi:hypothetical protein